MMASETLRLAELMASRLCHDLVGPLGAVSNGLELAADDPGLAEEALALSREALEKLLATARVFRVAYGVAGDDLSAAEARGLLEDYLAKHRIDLHWDPVAAPVARGVAKLVMNAVLLAVEALPRGGEIAVENADREIVARIRATGAGLRTPEACLAVMDGEAEPTACHLQGALLKRFCARAGYRVVVRSTTRQFEFSLIA